MSTSVAILVAIFLSIINLITQEDLAKQIRGFEVRMDKTEKGLDNQQIALEKRVDSLKENMTSALEDRMNEHLKDMNEKTSANDLAIENLRYKVDLKLAGIPSPYMA